jgi:hypothetical protein
MVSGEVPLALHTAHGNVSVPFRLFELDLFHHLIRHTLAPRIHVLRPRIRRAIQDGKPEQQTHKQRLVARILHPCHLRLALVILVVRRHTDTVHHPCKDRLHERSVQQVNGKPHLSEEEQNFTGQDFLQTRAEHNADGGEHEADAAGETGEIWILGQVGLEKVGKVVGPGHPLGVGLGVRGDVDAGEDEDGGEHGCKNALLVDEAGGSGLELKFGDEHTPEAQHAEDGWEGQLSAACVQRGDSRSLPIQ